METRDEKLNRDEAVEGLTKMLRLIGAVQLAPTWMFQAHDAILAVDIGGTNIRAGVVQLNLDKEPDLSKAKVWKFERWRHAMRS